METTNIKEKTGIVALIDLLGAKYFTKEQNIQFIKNRDQLIGYAHEISKNFLKELDCEEQLDISTIGDTIVICWPFSNPNKTLFYLKGMFHIIKTFISLSIFNQNFYRGAISIGEYLTSDDTILGPAITDAAGWYEKADWFGVVLTPKCDITVTRILAEEKPSKNTFECPMDILAVKYNVPIKGGEISLFCIAWPFEIFMLKHYTGIDKIIQELPPLAAVTNFIYNIEIPLGTEMKYYNSLDFFSYYGTNIFPKMKKTPYFKSIQ